MINHLGYVKGHFNDGSLLKGEVYNAYLINGYSEESFIKKIIIDGKAKKNSIELSWVRFFLKMVTVTRVKLNMTK